MQIKKVLKYLTKHSTLAQRLYRAYRRAQRSAQDPDWTKMLGNDGQWERAREAAKNGPVVLLATFADGRQQSPPRFASWAAKTRDCCAAPGTNPCLEEAFAGRTC